MRVLKLFFLLLLTVLSIPISAYSQEVLNYKRAISVDSVNYISSFNVNGDNIYAVDLSTFRISRHDSIGGQLNLVGGKGQGPGEYSEVPKFVIDRDSVVGILDRNNMRLNFYNEFLKPLENSENNSIVKYLNFRRPPSDVSFSDDGNLFVSFLPIDNIESVQVFNKKRELVSSFSPEIKPGNFILNSFYINSLPQNRILLSFRFINLFQVYTVDGELLNSFSIDDLPSQVETTDVSPNSPYGRDVPKDLLIFAPTISSNGTIYVVAAKYSPQPNKLVFQLSDSGVVENKFILQKYSSQIIHDGGQLYSLSAADDATIHVYDIAE